MIGWASSAFFMLVYLPMRIGHALKNVKWPSWLDGPWFWLCIVLFYGIPITTVVSLVVGLLTLDAIARVYIIVEAFISLRHVPSGVYLGMTWAQYIPHM